MRQLHHFCDSHQEIVSPQCRVLWHVVTILAVITSSAVCNAGPKARLVEVRDDVRTYVGKVVAKDSDFCYLMEQSGALARLPVAQLDSFKVVSETFRPSSVAEIRQQLQSEFRSGYEIRTSAHYVVVGKKGNTLAYASLFEEIYRQVVSFYSRHGFETNAPEVALIAIVFGTQEEFKSYCERDEVLWSKDLRGYYSLKTNRVALYDDPDLLKNATAATLSPGKAHAGLISANYSSESSMPETDLARRLFSVTSETASTIIHETTHQVGYNIGVHSRIGDTPVWVIEGLATVLESPGVRTKGKASASNKINAERLEWFTAEYQSRRQPGDLAKLIASDDLFHNQTLDAYSAAWAFSYFLTENPARAKLFVRYLRMLSERDPMLPYRPEDRLKDFQKVFGDISRLELDYLRATDQL
jgi:hypothetical protein